MEFDVPVPEHLEVAICKVCFPFSSGVLKGKIELSRASDVLAGVLLAERPENKGIPLFWNHDFLVQPRCLELPVYACFKGGVITIRCNLECNVKRGWLKLRLGVRDRVKFKCAFKTKRHWS